MFWRHNGREAHRREGLRLVSVSFELVMGGCRRCCELAVVGGGTDSGEWVQSVGEAHTPHMHRTHKCGCQAALHLPH